MHWICLSQILLRPPGIFFLNKFSVQGLIEKSDKFIVPLAVGDRLISWGVPPGKIVELDWWQEYGLDQNLMIAATPAQHFSVSPLLV